MPDALSPDLLRKMQAYWRAANYLSVGQIYLQDNPLLDSPLEARTLNRGCLVTGGRRRD
jgi:xylulose-5-phosphate/fructose-6-phosphate phosphoketolase